MPFTLVANGPITLNVAVEGSGPLIVCIHGWPELSHAWRHQLAHFSALGYTVAAMDVRGYGGSSKPYEISAYSMRNLTADVAAVIDALGGGKAILFGHDWGAPIAWNTAVLYPDKVSAVAGLSVPYTPIAPRSFMDVARSVYKGRFFYQLYIQAEGVAEAEFEADVRTALRKLYYSSCGDAPRNGLFASKPADAKLLDGLVDPDPFPAWMSESDLQVFVDAFTSGGLRGPFNRYRVQDIDSQELGSLPNAVVTQPSFFIAGEKDPVRAFLPGHDLYANPGAACSDFRGSVILPGIGHWVQQEAPAATNAALESFLNGL
jgi:pimeloyl-ACP methyl ester carboxylesterase